jgi:ribose/xylose/arabinose/galactoside ABC-type transport system permease subunit
MKSTASNAATVSEPALFTPRAARRTISSTFVRVGVLPLILLAAIVVFSLLSNNFLTSRNLTNVFRQSVFLTIVSLGQMMVLLTGGFDLSVGTTIALTSVVGAMAMAAAAAAMPDMVPLAITIGCMAGLLSGLGIGLINGLGVALVGVSPFIMTLGLSSIGFGIALYLTGGTPVYGMPKEFGGFFGFGVFLGIPIPIWVALGMIAGSFVLVNWTRFGRTLYAVGGNIRAAELSGVNTKKTLLFVYMLSALFAAVAGMLLTARMDTGEANIGSSMPLESIAACVIAGVSLRGGIGRMENVVIGALFISLLQNGMNLARFNSYLQTIVIGCILILAVAVDQIRRRYILGR